MKDLTCEEVLMAKMAELDGEARRSEEAERHLLDCKGCLNEVAAMQSLHDRFLSHQRAEASEVNIWPRLEHRISPQAGTFGWQPFAVVAAGLIAFKVVEMSLENDPGLLFALIPIAL